MVLAPTTEIIPLIADAQGVLRIGNTRVTLDTVLAAFADGATAEEIVQQYSSLHLADVYSVIGYYLPHIAGNGPNAIYQFRFDAHTGRLTPNSPAQVSPARPDGPRHFCFHPSKNLVYVSNEQGCSVTAYAFDSTTGLLSPLQTVSTLPAEGYEGRNSCSQIQIAPSGKFVYAPNRGHNSLACFAVDATTGYLSALGHMPSEAVPRAFSLDPTGTFLYAAGLESGRLAAYRIEQTTGLLQPLEVYPVGTRPMWVMILRLE